MQKVNAWKLVPKKAAFALLIAAMAPGMQACTDQEVATGMAIVAIGAAAVAVGAADSGRGGSCHVTTRCRTYRDYRGYKRQECSEYRDCGRRYRHSINFDGMEAGLLSSSPQVSADGFADTFGISKSASDRVLSALESARRGDSSQLASLGLDNSEIRRLGNYRLPSAQGIDAMARTLDQDSNSVKQMMQRLIQIAQEQRRLSEDYHGGH